MKIRRFKIGDERALFGVFFSSIHDVASRDYSPAQIAAWAPADLDEIIWARRMQGNQPFVAQVDGVIAGFAGVQPNGYIDQFFVAGTYGGLGIGRMLMARIHEEAVTLRLKELTSDVSKTAEGFFSRSGFEVLERRFPVRSGQTLENAFMRKML